MVIKAALYGRVSTRDKEQNPETQLLILRDWAQRQGLAGTEFVDYASGGNLNRPGWQNMMAAVRAGKFDVIAVLRLDRAFRSVVDMHSTLSDLDARGVRFAAVTQPVDTGTAIGRLLINVLGSVAEFERDITRERIMEGLARSRREGKRPGPKRKPLSGERARRAVNEHGSEVKAAAVLGVSRSLLKRRLSEFPAPPVNSGAASSGEAV